MADGTNQRGPGSTAPHSPQHDPATAPTGAAPCRAAAPGASPTTGTPGVHGRFEPGTRLGARYRIVGLLGRGGMGEVYRADDLELGESVALKFLPPHVAGNASWLARFRNEVRVARQIAHPNVCRVYDIGEAEGELFLSMEYIDGEDLASVLRRMGRPGRDKAVEIARQLCVGLGAAHERGVLHRDLKPANVMIDGRGRVRLTDFGLAGSLDEIGGERDRAGTPAYMAPEQLASGTVSARSDIYSLGLILHEVFTGRCVYETDDETELKRLHESGEPQRPSALARDIDPAVERLIVRCLEKDPRERPVSVYAVLGALPGGDPLAAVLAAGETPSPELLVNAGQAGGLSPRVALACAGAVATVLVAGTLVTQGVNLMPVQPPDVLAVKAAELLERLGHADLPRLSASGFMLNESLLGELKRRGEGWGRLADDRLPVFLFWRRWSANTLLPVGQHAMLPGHDNPPQRAPGSATVVTDTRGRLVFLEVVPPETQPPDPESRTDLVDPVHGSRVRPVGAAPHVAGQRSTELLRRGRGLGRRVARRSDVAGLDPGGRLPRATRPFRARLGRTRTPPGAGGWSTDGHRDRAELDDGLPVARGHPDGARHGNEKPETGPRRSPRRAAAGHSRIPGLRRLCTGRCSPERTGVHGSGRQRH